MDIRWITGRYTLNKVPIYPVLIHGISVVYKPLVLYLPVVWPWPPFIYLTSCNNLAISAGNLVFFSLPTVYPGIVNGYKLQVMLISILYPLSIHGQICSKLSNWLWIKSKQPWISKVYQEFIYYTFSIDKVLTKSRYPCLVHPISTDTFTLN